MGDFAACLRFTLLPENDGQPFHQEDGDPGGATAWGITYATFCTWRSYCGEARPTIDELRDISVLERDAIYRGIFWRELSGDDLPRGVDLMVFDFAVTAGVREASRCLQRTLGFSGAALDGQIGPDTLGTTAGRSVDGLIDDLARMQDAFYRTLLSFDRFGRGWGDRTTRRWTASLRMLQPAPPSGAVSKET
ncbi:MAG: glycosyl hydrolase 108 family protein [Bradyrhizobium sp.]